jgi:xanthine dehydrogenase accessory factor
VRHYGAEGEASPRRHGEGERVDVFIESWAPPPQMVIFGAVDFTAALAKVAKVLGYRVTVCDAREIFATKKRFPMADDVAVDWPNRLLMDRIGPSDRPRRGVRAHPRRQVRRARHPGSAGHRVGYIGVMGSRKTHAKRLERLAEVGVSDPADLDRLMSPIGLDIGARSPEETAVSICAEIIARRTGRNAPSLREGSGPIH